MNEFLPVISSERSESRNLMNIDCINILLVEDEPDLVLIIRNTLTSQGFNVRTAMDSFFKSVLISVIIKNSPFGFAEFPV